MTDMPVFGILCCGKNINELAESVRGCGHITSILKDGGFVLGGYHTAMVRKNDEALRQMCENKLYHLTGICDAVFSVGAEGFAADDILPEITMELCDTEAVFFTSNLCGLANISNYDSAGQKRQKQSFLPSRSRAGVVGSCLVMNIRSDEDFIKTMIPALLPSLTFAVSCLSGKDAGLCKTLNDSLKEMCSLSNQNRRLFFDKIQKLETKNS